MRWRVSMTFASWPIFYGGDPYRLTGKKRGEPDV